MIDRNTLRRTASQQVGIGLLAIGLGLTAPLVAHAGIQSDAADHPDVTWQQAKMQATLIWQDKPAFPAAYSGSNSLSPHAEQGYSLSGTGYLGLRVQRHTEIYLDPEVVSSQALSNGQGLGGLTNGENQKGSLERPQFYIARAFIRQTWNLGGETQRIESDQNQMADVVDKRRLVITAGKMSVTDLFDTNSLTGDPRTQFLNWSYLADGAYDYASETKGYTVGAALALYFDDWTLRIGRFEQPRESNGSSLDPHIFQHNGDQIEVTHDHVFLGQTGNIKCLVFRNRANMGRFQDALNWWQAQGKAVAPNVADVRHNQTKTGYAVNIDQMLSINTGVFFRFSRNDGQQETYAFTEIDQQIEGGTVVHGSIWGRPDDIVGVAYASNGLSRTHQSYLRAGGLGVFLGDGSLNYGREDIFETYYKLPLTSNASVSADYQRILHPGYNADRGPVNVFSTRLHVEF